ncbi:MAG TPA: LamG domain-containing protein [Nannocystaceae bacterium]|nr:LamG domain-containing protein [Nannocystaceae bacterium]
MRALAVGALFGSLAAWGCSSGAFACEDTEECRDGDRIGTCQPDGFCSFPDGDCASGQRYGSHAGALSGECVVPVADTDAATSTTSSTGAGMTGLEASASATMGSHDDADTSGDTTLGLEGSGSSTSASASEGGPETSSTGIVENPELVLWLELEDASFAAGIVDSSPLGLPVACGAGGCPTAVAGPYGQAALFDGEEQCIVVPHDVAFEDLTELTVSAWVQPLAPAVELNHMVVAKPLGAENGDSFELYVHDAIPLDDEVQARFAAADDLVSATAIAPRPTVVGDWMHMAGTWDGAEVTVWVGGAAVATAPLAAIGVDEHGLMVGCDDDVGGTTADNVFVGAVDDVRVYRVALTADEIATLAAGDAP